MIIVDTTKLNYDYLIIFFSFSILKLISFSRVSFGTYMRFLCEIDRLYLLVLDFSEMLYRWSHTLGIEKDPMTKKMNLMASK